jgi:hypothetical protein
MSQRLSSRDSSSSIEDGIVDEGAISIMDQIKEEGEKRRNEETKELAPRMPGLRKEYTLPVRTTEKFTFKRPVQMVWKNVNFTLPPNKGRSRNILKFSSSWGLGNGSLIFLRDFAKC